MNETQFTVDKTNLEVRMTRVFNAPREKIWEAMTTPEIFVKWWGPAVYTNTIDTFDFRVGGTWRVIQKDKDGNEFAFHGEYKEIVPPEKIVNTFEYEPMAGHVLTETAVLEALSESQTRLTTTSKYANIEDLEGMVASGMEWGARESWDRLAGVVEKAG